MKMYGWLVVDSTLARHHNNSSFIICVHKRISFDPFFSVRRLDLMVNHVTTFETMFMSYTERTQNRLCGLALIFSFM